MCPYYLDGDRHNSKKLHEKRRAVASRRYPYIHWLLCSFQGPLKASRALGLVATATGRPLARRSLKTQQHASDLQPCGRFALPDPVDIPRPKALRTPENSKFIQGIRLAERNCPTDLRRLIRGSLERR